jgi:hypothetical protein
MHDECSAAPKEQMSERLKITSFLWEAGARHETGTAKNDSAVALRRLRNHR